MWHFREHFSIFYFIERAFGMEPGVQIDLFLGVFQLSKATSGEIRKDCVRFKPADKWPGQKKKKSCALEMVFGKNSKSNLYNCSSKLWQFFVENVA